MVRGGHSRFREKAFRHLYEEHASGVYNYARRRGLLPHEAEDLVAETFLTAWRRFDEIPESRAAWLYGVARNIMANQARAARRQQLLQARATQDAQPADAVRGGDGVMRGGAEGNDAFWVAFAGIPPADREALSLVYWEGLRQKEAAQVLGCSAGAFLVRLSRARRRLAAALERATA